jgi:hypothetical protein
MPVPVKTPVKRPSCVVMTLTRLGGWSTEASFRFVGAAEQFTGHLPG